jgi:hypothetical protein
LLVVLLLGRIGVDEEEEEEEEEEGDGVDIRSE